MSTFTHIDQAPVYNEVLRTTVPPRWNHLLSDALTQSTDTSLRGISRTVYASPSQGTPVRGEVWVASGASTAQTFKVTAGGVQMYVASGAGSVIKNGETIFLHDGEKVSFNKGDTFSFPVNHEMRIFVRNENASFAESTPTRPVSALSLPPTEEDVRQLRAELGIAGPPSTRPFRAPTRTREPMTSYGYARSKVG